MNPFNRCKVKQVANVSCKRFKRNNLNIFLPSKIILDRILFYCVFSLFLFYFCQVLIAASTWIPPLSNQTAVVLKIASLKGEKLRSIWLRVLVEKYFRSMYPLKQILKVTKRNFLLVLISHTTHLQGTRFHCSKKKIHFRRSFQFYISIQHNLHIFYISHIHSNSVFT